MKNIFTFFLILFAGFSAAAQTFVRSQLPTSFNTPWEMTYGPDGFLWITELPGIVSRVNPTTGSKTIVYTAPDYFAGSPGEQLQLCFKPNIGSGTLGLALHPNFLNSSTSFIYYMYSYNSGSMATPVTKFKIVRLTWDSLSGSVIGNADLIMQLPTGYDHLGGRLMAITQNSTDYLYCTVGDNGISETNNPTCYSPQSSDPNNFTQDPNYKTGKVHRFNIDGTIPFDNPMPGNSFFTRGHRNPQGLMYNPTQNILYELEHGDRTDDEINILKKGMNYGWKDVRGYHADNNYPGEAAYISGYVPNPLCASDGLQEAFYSWCATPQPSSSTYTDWCTVAPSDGIYYNSTAIPNWTNSLLVVTLKDGLNTDQEVFQFKLDAAGTSIVPSTTLTPNPSTFFAADESLNGRLRDIAVSPDGTKIYLINNGGTSTDKITVYTYINSVEVKPGSKNEITIELFPNPSNEVIKLQCAEDIESVEICNLLGERMSKEANHVKEVNISNLTKGIYLLKINTTSYKQQIKKFVKE